MTIQHCVCGKILPHDPTAECQKPRARVEDGEIVRVEPKPAEPEPDNGDGKHGT